MTPEDRWSRPERLAPLGLAAVAFALHAACLGRYGIFRDELYFMVCGDRLAWGYVDQPPGIAAVARLATGLFGTWVPGLRLLPWLAAAGTVYLTGRLAARLGGGAAGAALASAAALAAPLFLALGHYLTMNAFELLLAAALANVVVRLARGGDGRLWAAAGALAGLGTLFKYTSALLAVALLAGLLLTPARRALASTWAIVGAVLGLLLVLPNLVWQAEHGYPFLELVRNGQLRKNAPFSIAGFVRDVVRGFHPLAAPVWLAGAGWALWPRKEDAADSPRDPAARALAIGAVGYLALLLVTRGKGYYAAPAFPALFALGGAALGPRLARPALAIGTSAALVTAGLALVPLAIPILPVDAFVAYQAALGQKPEALERHAYGVLPQVFADQHGWEELATAVAEAYRSLPPKDQASAGIFAQNYGEAAAIDVYGADLGLPPAASGHNGYFLWGPPPGRGDPLIVVSDDAEDCGGGAWRERRLAVRLPSSPWVMPYEDARSIWICRGLERPLGQLWPAVRNYQ